MKDRPMLQYLKRCTGMRALPEVSRVLKTRGTYHPAAHRVWDPDAALDLPVCCMPSARASGARFRRSWQYDARVWGPSMAEEEQRRWLLRQYVRFSNRPIPLSPLPSEQAGAASPGYLG